MRNHILFNPLAGHGSHLQQVEDLKAMLEGESVATDILKIESYKDFMLALAPEDKIILCGGDGTINRFVNESGFEDYPNEIYYYAMGSGNDFLHDVTNGSGEKRVKLNPYLKNLPTVIVNGESYKFINGVGYGLDGYCCQKGDELKARGKAVNYTLIAIKGLLFDFKPRNARVIVDGKKHFFKKVCIAPTMHGRCYGGGMIPTPEQDRLAGKGVSFMALHGAGRVKILTIFPSIFKGEHVKHRDVVTIIPGREVEVEFDTPCALQIDGETIKNVKKYKVIAK
jgi:diacylglycerol kinase family enzyme